MTTMLLIPERTQPFTDPEETAFRTRDAEPVLADAEEEEVVELWAGDPGNQGA